MMLIKKVWIIALGISLTAATGCATNKNAQTMSSTLERPAGLLDSEEVSHGQVQVPNPELPEMSAVEHEHMGDNLFSRGDYALAFIQYEKALSKSPGDSNVMYKMGLLLLSGELYKEAEATFQSLLEEDPSCGRGYEGLGMALFGMKRLDEAEEQFLKAVQLDSTLWKSHNFLGNIHDLKGEYKSSVFAYRNALSGHPHVGDVYNNLGVSHSLAGQYESAVAAFRKALVNGAPEDKVRNNLALALAKLGRHDEAFQAFRHSGDAQAYNNLGCVFMEQGNYEKAADCFEKAIALQPTFYALANDNLRAAKSATQ
jgi:Flp pilus assembly protein TadD